MFGSYDKYHPNIKYRSVYLHLGESPLILGGKEYTSDKPPLLLVKPHRADVKSGMKEVT